MPIYTRPFTYLIGWTSHKTFYYGVRYAKGCQPECLWVSYFTSSRFVKEFREAHGEPDIIEVRRVFEGVDEARSWEHKVLKRLKASKRSDFLNRTDKPAPSTQGYKFDPQVVELRNKKVSSALLGHKQSVETCKKKSDSHLGVKFSDEHRISISKTRLGMKFSEEHKSNISKSQTGTKREPYKPRTNEHSLAISKAKTGKPWSEARRAAQIIRSQLG